MNDDDYRETISSLFLGLSFFMIGCSLGATIGFHRDYCWRRELIKRNLAEYDIVTGEWRWKEGE